jgi:hypothetical protein
MNRYLKVGLVVFVGVCAGFAGGFFVGVKEGVWQFFLRESSVKASLLTYELQALRAGNTKKIIDAKEIELDGELVRFGDFRREGRPWVFWFQDGYERDHTKYMKRVAAYRNQYPPFAPTLDYGKDNPMKEEFEKYAQEVKAVTAEVLKEYGE